MEKDHRPSWLDNEELAQQMVPMIGELWNRQGIEIKVFGKSLINEPPLNIIQIIKRGNLIGGQKLEYFIYREFLDIISDMGLGLCKIDLGKLILRFKETTGRAPSRQDFIKKQLPEEFYRTDWGPAEPRDVVLFGFGRIGRILARLLIESTGPGRFFRLKAVVTRTGGGEDVLKRADLLRHDSVHGRFSGVIDENPDDNELVINGNRLKFITAANPAEVDYAAHGLKNVVLVDNTGKWRDREGLKQHLDAGAKRVVLTAPGKDDIPNIVFGINTKDMGDDSIVSCASCTTNAVAPVLKALHKEFKIKHGHIETVHSYTNDQNLLDNYHKSDRRGRAATINMVITSTGAASAVAKVVPELKGKLTGNSIRVPTPNVSLAMLNLSLERKVDRNELNEYLRKCAVESGYQKQIDYTVYPVVSSDLGKSIYSGIVDSQATLVHDDHVVVYVWYDNEYGYSHQVKRMVHEVCGDTIPEYFG